MPTAWWRTRTCPGPGWGVGISSSFRTDGPPYSETRIAFMRVSSLRMWAQDGGSGRGGIGSAHPERRGLADRLQIGAALDRAARVPHRQEVRVQHVPAALGAEEAGQVGERDEALLGSRRELAPAARVVFRPEEVHPGSEIVRPAARGAEAEGEVANQVGRVGPGDAAVAHLDRHRIAAVEAGRVDPHGLAREEPRRGRRLEAALREPPLLAADR